MTDSKKYPLIYLKNVLKKYSTDGIQSQIVLNSVNFEVNSGEFLAVVAPSGRGKSTLLYLIAGLDKPNEGRVFVDGNDLVEMNETQLALFRRISIGIIFQNFNLFPAMTVSENIGLVLQLLKMKRNKIKDKVSNLLDLVGLRNKANSFPSQLSGGEQQRVAIARALANDPSIILADEPTGNLDEANAQKIFQTFQELNREENRTILLVTHDYWFAKVYASRIMTIKEGKLLNWEESW